MDIMTGLSAAAQALDITRKLRDLEKDFDRAEFKMQIADLYTALSDARMALADAKEELAKKEAEIRSLKEAKTDKMRTVAHRGYNFGIDGHGKSIGRPFCPVCEKTKGIQIQITKGTGRHDICPSCKAAYSDHPWRLPDGFDPSGAV